MRSQAKDNTPSISADQKREYQRIANLSAREVANLYGCHYSGDTYAITHSGYFYDVRDWEKYGYASVVEFYNMDDRREPRVVVQRGTINRPDYTERMEAAWNCLWIGPNNPERDNVHAQIEACRAYRGIEESSPDHYFDRPGGIVFNLEDWPHEWRIWRSVLPWIAQLGPGREHYLAKQLGMNPPVDEVDKGVIRDRAIEAGLIFA